MAPCRKLYSPEGDWTFEGNLNGCLLHAVLPVERRVARRRCYAAEVPLNFDADGEMNSPVSNDSENDGDIRIENCDCVFLYLW